MATTPRNLGGFLSDLIGPVKIQDNGIGQTPRGNINFLGFTFEDDPANNAVKIAFRVTGIAGDEDGVATIPAIEFNYTGQPASPGVERVISHREASNTPVDLVTHPTDNNRLYRVVGYVFAQSANMAQMALWKIDALAKNVAGTLTIITASPVTEDHNESGTTSLVLDVDGEDLVITYTGAIGVPTRAAGRVFIHEIQSVPDL